MGMGCGIFRLFVGNSGNRHDPNKLSKGRWCLLPNQSPRGIIAYQLLTQCSIDSVAHCSFQPLQGFTFTVILRGFFPKVICYMVLDMANNDATSAKKSWSRFILCSPTSLVLAPEPRRSTKGN